jgi:hypothetical protein
MAHQTRLYRRQVYRKQNWRRVRRPQVRRALQALEALYRRA